MRYIIPVILSITVVLATFAGACGQDDEQLIRETMAGFLTAYNDEDFSGCLDYVSDNLRNAEGDEKIMADLQEGRASSGAAILDSVRNLEIDGKKANVSVSFQGFMGQVLTVKFPLIEESGNWKIDG